MTGGFFLDRSDHSRFRRGLRLNGPRVFVASWLVLSPMLALAESGIPAEQPRVRPGSRDSTSNARPIVAADVVLQPGGVLQGVLAPSHSHPASGPSLKGVRVALLRDGKLVAETKTGKSGRFTVSSLSGGKYVVAVMHQGYVHWHLHRLWSPGTSPPKASALARITLKEGIVRGQGPLPAVSFSEAALMAGVVVGAVAAPVIYHNAQQSNRVPASP